MGRKEEILERVRQIASPLASQEGLELVEVVLPEVTALDGEDPTAGAYDLEVSSPGLDRPLRTPEHFEKFKGSKVRVKTFGPLPECENRKTFVGTLQGYADGKVMVDVDGKLFHVPHGQVSKANVEAVFDI